MPCPEPTGSSIEDLRRHEIHIDEQMFKFMELEHQPASVQIPLLRRYQRSCMWFVCTPLTGHHFGT